MDIAISTSFYKRRGDNHCNCWSRNLIEYFPKEDGKQEETIDGYKVVRETSVKEIGKEKYIVTFKEDLWQIGNTKNSWLMSYMLIADINVV